MWKVGGIEIDYTAVRYFFLEGGQGKMRKFFFVKHSVTKFFLHFLDGDCQHRHGLGFQNIYINERGIQIFLTIFSAYDPGL